MSDSKPRKMRKTRHFIFTRHNFQSVCFRHDFTRAKNGSDQLLNKILLDKLEIALQNAIVNAEHNGRKVLNYDDAIKAIELTPELPNGLYERSKPKPAKAKPETEENKK